MKKIFLVLFAMIFAGNFLISTAQAEIKTFEGTGAYPLSDEKTHGEVKELAKKEAVRDALEKAGVAVYSETQVKNHTVTKDIIKITAGSILKILSDKYNLIELDENYGIGIYKATVKISIDTDELNLSLKNFLNIDNHEIKHYEELQKLNDANTKRIAELEKQLAEKNSSQNIQQIKDKIATIDKNTLSNQKFDEGFKLCKNDRKFREAIPIFNEALKLNPNNSNAYRELGWAYTKLKDYDKALFYRQKAIELNPNDLYAIGGIGDIYIARKEYEKAISFFNEAIKIHPEFAPFYSSRGEIYRCLKNYTKAMSDYDKAIQLDPNLAWIYRARGWTNCDLKNFSKAILDFEKAIELEPHRIESYNALGWIYNKIGEYNKALTILNKSVQINQNNADTFEKIAEVYSSLKQYKKAISYCDKSIKINPNNKNYFWAYVTRGFCYQALGENKKAEADFAKARQLGWNG